MKASDEMLTASRTRSVFALFHRIREHHEEAASGVKLMQFDNVEVILRRCRSRSDRECLFKIDRAAHSHIDRFTRLDTLSILRISCVPLSRVRSYTSMWKHSKRELFQDHTSNRNKIDLRVGISSSAALQVPLRLPFLVPICCRTKLSC